MSLDQGKLLYKLENHKKLLSMISDSIIPMKSLLLNDVAEIKQIIETASKQDKKENLTIRR